MKNIYLLNIAIIFGAQFAFANAQNYKNCQNLRSIYKLVTVSNSDETEVLREMQLAYKHLCSGMYSNNATVNYPNGQMATNSFGNGGYNWYYSNGKTITAGSDYSTWYYPNGQHMASSLSPGYSVYYPNGKIATSGWMSKNATWYYSNGQTITMSAGSKGYNWYYPNGKLISSSMGTQGSTWYSADGRILTNNGPEISEEKLLDVPKILFEFIEGEI